MEYPHKTILLNGRRVSIQKIIKGTEEHRTPFEAATLAFLKSWLTDQRTFHLNTSGSTGIPKKIITTRAQLIHSATLTITALAIKKGGKILLCIDPTYIGGKMMLVRALVNSMRIEAIEPTSIKDSISLPSSADLVAFVPLQIQSFLNSKKLQGLNKIKNILIGGAPITLQDARALSKSKTNIYLTYGMTETFSHIALKKISPVLEESFRVLPSVQISVDSRNCLVIKTPYNKKKIITNDLVSILDNHSFNWLGRADNVINSGGVKIIPEQIEVEIGKITKKLSIQNRFYIIGKPDKRLGEKVVIVLEGEKLTDATQNLFLNEMKQALPLYSTPKKIMYVKQFTFVNNKIKRK